MLSGNHRSIVIITVMCCRVLIKHASTAWSEIKIFGSRNEMSDEKWTIIVIVTSCSLESNETHNFERHRHFTVPITEGCSIKHRCYNYLNPIHKKLNIIVSSFCAAQIAKPETFLPRANARS